MGLNNDKTSKVFCIKSVVETVASLWRGVTEHCLNEDEVSKSHFPDKVDNTHTVKKSSTSQCNSSGHWRDK